MCLLVWNEIAVAMSRTSFANSFHQMATIILTYVSPMTYSSENVDNETECSSRLFSYLQNKKLSFANRKLLLVVFIELQRLLFWFISDIYIYISYARISCMKLRLRTNRNNDFSHLAKYEPCNISVFCPIMIFHFGR